MGKLYEEIDDRLRKWIGRQQMFFVGTAPRGDDGHVNVSPKGMAGTFAILGPQRVAYLDYFGSGAETIAHLRENGRIVVMFCAFEGPPKIIRLHGRGRVVLPEHAEFTVLRHEFGKERTHGQRSIIVVDVERIADSCGYSVPRMDFVADRDILDLHQVKRPAEYYERDAALHRNGESIDRLPALPGLDPFEAGQTLERNWRSLKADMPSWFSVSTDEIVAGCWTESERCRAANRPDEELVFIQRILALRPDDPLAPIVKTWTETKLTTLH